MKNFKFFFLVLVLFTAACGNDDGVNPDATLVGTWEAQSVTAEVETTSEFSGESFTTILDVTGNNLDYIVTFTESTYSTQGDYGFAGQITVNDMANTFDESYTNVSGNGAYSLEGDEITSDGAFFQLEVQGIDVSAIQGEVKATIEKLTDTELIFVQDSEETTTQTQGGVSVEVLTKTKSRSVWKRR